MSNAKQLDFVGIGPQKTASTWLFSMLKNHPDISFPDGIKETFFWDENYSRGLDWYFSHFTAPRKAKSLLAEIGPTYFTSEDAASRIFYNNDRCKVIVTLRSPVERSFSLYLHHRTKGRIRCPFREAVESIPEIIEGSRYSKWLPLWLNRFGEDNVLIVLQDDVQTCPGDQLARVLDFLSLNHIEDTILASQRINAASWPRNYWIAKLSTGLALILRKLGLYSIVNAAKRMGIKDMVYSGDESNMPVLDVELARELHREFAPDINYIEELIGRKLDSWRRHA